MKKLIAGLILGLVIGGLAYPSIQQEVGINLLNSDTWIGARGTTGGEIFSLSMSRQIGTVSNTQTTGASNTAVTTTITTSSSQIAIISKITARCSASTANITVTDGSSTIWSTSSTAVGTTNFTEQWETGLTSPLGADPIITLSTCGVGNTGTLIVQASSIGN